MLIRMVNFTAVTRAEGLGHWRGWGGRGVRDAEDIAIRVFLSRVNLLTNGGGMQTETAVDWCQCRGVKASSSER